MSHHWKTTSLVLLCLAGLSTNMHADDVTTSSNSILSDTASVSFSSGSVSFRIVIPQYVEVQGQAVANGAPLRVRTNAGPVNLRIGTPVGERVAPEVIIQHHRGGGIGDIVTTYPRSNGEPDGYLIAMP